MTAGGPVPMPYDGVADHALAYPLQGPPGNPGQRGPEGPPGPPGADGADGGPGLFTGQGVPPDYLPGAKPGDTYVDTLTGTIYTLT